MRLRLCVEKSLADKRYMSIDILFHTNSQKMFFSYTLTIFSVLLSFTSVGSSKHLEFEKGFVEKLFHRLDELERKVEEQRLETDVLRKENAELGKIREENTELKNEIDILTKKVDQHNYTIERLVKETHDETKANEAYSGELSVPSHTANHNRIRQLDQGPTIAFFATLRGSAEHLGQNQPIVFDRAVTNVGQAYHNATGVFIAPVSGVYVFSTTILTYKETAHFKFTLNGQAYSNLISYNSETYETLSQTVILNLVKGDDVAIQSYDSDKFVNGNHYSTFSGFLLSQREEDFIVG